MNARTLIATLPMARDHELRFEVGEHQGERRLYARVFGPPSTPALLRFPEKAHLTIPVDDIGAVVHALTQVQAFEGGAA